MKIIQSGTERSNVLNETLDESDDKFDDVVFGDCDVVTDFIDGLI